MKSAVKLPMLPPMELGRGVKYDWEAIRKDYVFGGMAAPALAAKHGVAQSTVEARCGEGGWVELRREYEDGIRQDAYERNLQRVSEQWRQRFAEVEQMAKLMQEWIATQRDRKGGVTPEDLARLSKAQDLIIKNQRLLMGESTENLAVIDRQVEKVVLVVQKYVTEADMERFLNDVAGILGLDFRAAAPQPAPAS